MERSGHTSGTSQRQLDYSVAGYSGPSRPEIKHRWLHFGNPLYSPSLNIAANYGTHPRKETSKPWKKSKETSWGRSQECMNLIIGNSYKLSVCTPLREEENDYLIIYVWWIMEGQAPNISTADNGGIRTKWHIHRGRCCLIPTVSNQSSHVVKTLRYASFAIHAPRLFNALPAHVRDITGGSVDSFKRQLDKYLRTVPDEPQITGYTAILGADSNSILHMMQSATAQLVSTLEGPDSLSVARGGLDPWSPWE